MTANYKSTVKSIERSAEEMADTVADMARNGGKAAVRAAEDAATAVMRKVEDAGEALNDLAETGLEGQGSSMGAMMRKAQDAKGAIVAGAGNTLAAVRDVALEKAEDARETLSDVGARLSANLQRASSEDGADALKSRVLGTVATGLSTASDALRQRSVADLGSDVRLLAKRHPGAFMAVAAVAGFAAARFVRASAKRRLDHADRGHEQGPRV